MINYSISPVASASRWLIFALVATVLSSCASVQPTVGAKVVAVEPIVARPDGSVRGDTGDQSVARLWASAERAREDGKDAIALELLYEALELSPKSALLWSRAAEIQLDNLDASLAESFATKSNAFALDNQPLLYRNWLIIEHARDMRGDLLGVRSAHKKVQQYQYQYQ